MTRRFFGTSSSSFTSFSLKAPIQHEPIPRSQAVRAMFSIAIDRSIKNPSKGPTWKLASGFAKQTMTAAASPTKSWSSAASASLLFISRSVTTMNCQGWLLLADYASLAASRILAMASLGKDLSLYLLILPLFLITSKTGNSDPRAVTRIVVI